MSLYESTFIARHDMSSQQVESLAENFTNIVKENGGEIAKTEFWGLKTLAYRIKKNRKGHYVYFNVDAPAAALIELERNMRLSEDVLRYLTVRVDALDPDPSPMMQARASRDDRSRRGGRPRGESSEPNAAPTVAAGAKETDTAKPDEKPTESTAQRDAAGAETAKPDEKPTESTAQRDAAGAETAKPDEKPTESTAQTDAKETDTAKPIEEPKESTGEVSDKAGNPGDDE